MPTHSGHADLILLAETIHTFNGSAGAQAVAVSGGLITAVGSKDEARSWRGPGTQIIDLKAGTLTPGLVDGHIHPVMGLTFTEGIDLSAVASLAELQDRLRAAAQKPRDGWVTGWGLDPNIFRGGPVTNAAIDEAVPDLPVFLRFSDAHSGLANGKALALAGVTGPVEFSQAAEVVCDVHGNPTGQLQEDAAVGLVTAVVPRAPQQERTSRFRALLSDMAATGLTAANVMDFEEDSPELVAAIDADGVLPLQLRFAPFCFPGVTTEYLDHIVELQRSAGSRWRVDGVKFMIDGTIDGGTAWLEAPDTHGESTAPFWPDPEEYKYAVQYLSARGVPIVTHAIGDAGVRYALDVLGNAPAAGVPHRIEHIESIPSDLVPKFREYGVVASMQPTHCTHYTSADQSDNWSQRLGPERAGRAFRTRDIRDSGALLALGSDWPVAPYDPRPILADAQLRRPAGKPDVAPVVPGQALTALMALEGYTSHAAAAAGAAGTAGRIAEGFQADFTAFTVDPLRADPDELAEAPIALTVSGGHITHREASLS